MSGVPGMMGLPVRADELVVSNPALLLDEPFDNLSGFRSYDFDQSTAMGGLNVTNGQLGMSDSIDHSWHTRFRVEDAQHVLKVIPGASANRTIYLMLKYVDASNLLMVQVNSDGSISFNRLVAGAYTALGLAGANVIQASSPPVWIAGSHTGNDWQASYYFGDPSLGHRAEATVTHRATGTAATALGAGVKGYAGARLSGYSGAVFSTTDWKIDDWRVSGLDRSRF